MQVTICRDTLDLARRAATDGAECIRRAIAERGQANIILATGASQLDMLQELVKAPAVEWNRVVCFHLDEYPGMAVTHPASFHKYLQERFIDQLPLPPKVFHFLRLEECRDRACCLAECQRVGDILRRHSIDVAFIGIGENGHLAFNDPPADFQTEEPFILVKLDDACRRQQFGEGWFQSLDDVPKEAVSMSIRQILKSQTLICSVPDSRKSPAVKNAVEGPITPQVPASILQTHADVAVYLDPSSAALLAHRT